MQQPKINSTIYIWLDEHDELGHGYELKKNITPGELADGQVKGESHIIYSFQLEGAFCGVFKIIYFTVLATTSFTGSLTDLGISWSEIITAF